MKRALFVLIAVLFASVASAQSVINPRVVEYTPSTDHGVLTKYVLGFFLVGADNPVQSVDLPIVAPDGGTGKVTQPMPFSSLGFGTYVVRLKSVVGASEGEWSDPSNQGVRAPLAPAVPPFIRR